MSKRASVEAFNLMWVLQLVVGIIAAFFVFALAYKCVGTSESAKKSLTDLATLAKTVQEKGGMNSKAIVLDKDTGLFIFNRDSKGITVVSVYNSRILPAKNDLVFIPKPKTPECEKTSCICRYSKLPSRDDVLSKKSKILTFVDGSYGCVSSDIPYFYNPGFYGSSFVYALPGDYRFRGGLFLERTDYDRDRPKKDVLEERDPKSRIRSNTIYMHKYKEAILVCEWNPCVEDVTEQDFDAELATVVKQ